MNRNQQVSRPYPARAYQGGRTMHAWFTDLLRKADVSGLILDDLVALSRYGKDLRSEFEVLQIEVPVWLDEAQRIVAREVDSRRRDVLQARLREARRQFEALATNEEKRARAKADIDRIEAQLA